MDNYSSMKLECLALKWAVCEKFREYLLGNPFTVYTDNNHLCHLQTSKVGALEKRRLSQLASFNFSIKYRPGRVNRNADGLSRQVIANATPGTEVPQCLHDRWGESPLEQLEVQGAEISVFPECSQADLSLLQTLDTVIGPIFSAWKLRRHQAQMT